MNSTCDKNINVKQRYIRRIGPISIIYGLAVDTYLYSRVFSQIINLSELYLKIYESYFLFKKKYR